MKNNTLLILLIFCTLCGFSQSILVIPNTDCKISVDGKEKGKVKANEALKIDVSMGDHYIQATGKWNGSEKVVSKTMTIDANKQTIVNITFSDDPATPSGDASAASNMIKVADVGVTIQGTLTVGTWMNNNDNKPFPDYPTYYYGFEKGDEIVIDYTSNSNSTNAIEVSECSNSAIKYSNKSFTELHNIHIKVDERGVFKFTMSTKHMMNVTGELSIKRIPASDDSKKFNTDVVWKDVPDTTYNVEQERYLIKSDTTIIDLSSPTVEVHSRWNTSMDNHEYIPLKIPANTISWGYYIGVDQSEEQAFTDGLNNLTKAALPILSKFPTAGPIGAFILGGVNYVNKLESGESVSYTLVHSEQDRNMFIQDQSNYHEYKSGDIINDMEKMSGNINGQMFFCFRNNNKVTPIHVTLKVTALTVNQQWDTKPIKKMSVVTKHLPFNAN